MREGCLQVSGACVMKYETHLPSEMDVSDVGDEMCTADPDCDDKKSFSCQCHNIILTKANNGS